ncbi:recombinase family protein [Streptantibioticus ferralitis]|uniref:Recombinase family protein n=1 Tax=Streptantibioticus ferralitis TaxID=236510 RepID=A0ABT5YV64_9ACTN|nr:recombinase family protein [Streptantibioticus ferralitis]MDF2255363.1 recombinase family protein [Streptantibioticus ferralitis]
MTTNEQASGPTPLRSRRIAKIAGTQRGKRHRSSWAGETAAIYCRISHVNDDDQTGVDRQQRLCREVAERLQLNVPNDLVFVDNNRSAWSRKRKRKGWDALLNAAREGQVRHILVYHPDRLMRQPYDLEELLQVADDNDLTLHGQANQRDLSDPDDRFFLRIEVAHACRSSDDTSRRLTDATIDRAKDGLPHGGKRRYGYDKTGLKVIPEEAEIVREIFAGYLDGKTPQKLARELNERKVPTALGKEWNPHNVRALLDNYHVAGIRVFRGKEVGDGEWPAIIDRGTWNEARDRRQYRSVPKPADNDSNRFYLLRGIVTCKRCGTYMSGSDGRYLCSRSQRTDSQACGRAASAPTLERFIVDAAIKQLEKLDITGATSAPELGADDKSAIEEDERELEELKAMWDAREIKTREYREMRKTIEDRISSLRRKLVVRPTVEVLKGLVGPQARASWEALEEAEEFERMNAVLRFLFAAVIIDASSTRGRAFDYGRVDIDPNPL